MKQSQIVEPLYLFVNLRNITRKGGAVSVRGGFGRVALEGSLLAAFSSKWCSIFDRNAVLKPRVCGFLLATRWV
jgi:hypothetical protein